MFFNILNYQPMILLISTLIKRLSGLQVFAQVCIVLFTSSLAWGQTVISTGTTLKVLPGTFVTSNENLVLNNGGSLDVQGTLILKKELQNQNAASNSIGTGTVEFSGAVAQSVSGQNTIQNLTLNNVNGLTVGGNTRVNGTLALSAGRISLGANNLLLGPSASVSGAPSASNMVVATGAGELRKEYASAGSFSFPVGDATGTAEYSPVTLAFNSGTFGAGNYAGVKVVDAQYAGTATSYLTRYWSVSHSGITGFSCNSTFQYVTADVVGTEADIFCTRVLHGPFTAYNMANTGLNTIDANGLASFGTFTGNLGDATVPPPIRSLQNKTISVGPECADATQTLLIAGNGTTYLVTNTGNVKHIAGVKIIYYPGTKVNLGGYMRGYISTIFCNPYNHPGANAPLVADIENPGVANAGNSFIKIYPNPTHDKFTLELTGDVTASRVHIEILGILGDKILSKEVEIDRKQEFSLSDRPTGIYMIRVASGQNTETQKIIKR